MGCHSLQGIFPTQGLNLHLCIGRHILYHCTTWEALLTLQLYYFFLIIWNITSIFQLLLTLPGFPVSSAGKESTCNAGDPGLIPGLRRSAGEGIGCPLQYSWASLVAQLVKNLPAMWETWVGKIPWRRERLPTPVFWPGESVVS